MENQRIEEPPDSENDASNIVAFVSGKRKGRVPKASDQEIVEYRALLPRLRRMLDEWDQLRGQHGCPVMIQILDRG